MKKSIIALLLVVSMVLGFTLTAFADAGGVESGNKMDDLTVGAYNTARTDSVPLKDGESYTITFHNDSDENAEGWGNWFNFVLVLSATKPNEETEKDILYVRADRWCDPGEDNTYFPDKNYWVFGHSPNWTDVFVPESKNGFDVTIHLVRDGNTIIYDATMGSSNVKMTAVAKEDLPETINVALTGTHCALTNILFTKSSFNTTEFSFSDLPTVGYDTVGTPLLPLSDGDSYTFKFHNQSKVGEKWDNWHIFSLRLKDFEDKMVMQIRGDNWETGGNGPYFDDISSFTGAPITADWQADATAGFDVEATLSRESNTLKYTANIMNGKYTMTMTDTALTALPSTIYVYLTGEQCDLTDIHVVKNAKDPTEPDPSEPQTTDPQTTDPEPADDSVTITGFKTETAESVKLIDGASVTFNFRNKSNGDENWFNFIFDITNVNINDGVNNIVTIRADNYAWGDPATYYDRSNGTLVGMNDTPDEWANWLAAAQAGVDVEVTITKNGNTINYQATIGEDGKGNTMTLTSKIPLPEEITVNLTGERCVLSNISYTVEGRYVQDGPSVESG